MRCFKTCFTISSLLLVSLISCAMPDAGTGSGDGSPSSPYQIYTAEELNAVRGGVTGYEEWDLTDSYILMADIDLSEYDSWEPMGTVGILDGVERGFSGTFNGNSHEITSLVINSSTSTVGLFGSITADGMVTGLRISGADVTGRANTGILAGSNYGTVSRSFSSGSVESTGGGYVGGLIGLNEGTVSLSGSTADVLSSSSNNGEYAGGLVGFSSGVIEYSYAAGSVEGADNNVGGFTGSFSGTISNSYATGDVVGSVELLGGFSGNNQGGYLTSCYSSGNVSLSVVTKMVSSGINGFIGQGIEDARNLSCYYDSDLSGYSDDFAADIDLTNSASFTGFDFSSVWSISSTVNNGMPYLKALSY